MISDLLQGYTIDCSSINTEEKSFSQVNRCFDLAHLSLDELTEVVFASSRRDLLFAAWKKVMNKFSEDDLCSVVLPVKWLETISDEDERIHWHDRFEGYFIDLWLDLLEVHNSTTVYFKNKKVFSDHSFKAFLLALGRFVDKREFSGQESPIHLFLDSHSLNNENIRLLVKVTKRLPLVYLNLSENNISNAGKNLADLIENNPDMRVLQLCNTGINDEDIVLILKAIRHHGNFRELHVSIKGLSSEVCRLLANFKSENDDTRVILES